MADLPIASPLINGVPVRFFRAPLNVPHLPWHALDDLYRAMKFPRDLRKRMLEHSRGFAGGDFKTVATSDGPVVIGSHPMAQGLIGAAIEAHGVLADFERLYAKGAVEAMKSLTGDLSPMDSFHFTIAAARNTLGVGR